MQLPENTRVVMRSKSNCPYCDEARAWLDSRGVAYEEVKLEDQAERNALYDKLGLIGSQRTVPQISIEDDLLGLSYPVGGSTALARSGLA